MTDWSDIAFAAGQTDYIARLNTLRERAQVLAPAESPALTGTPTAPTAAAGTNTTQLATTEFVTAAVAAGGGGSGADTYTTTTQQTTTSTSFTDVTGLSFTAEAGGVYLVEVMALYGNNGSGGGAGISLKLACAGSGTAGASISEWTGSNSGGVTLTAANANTATVAATQNNYTNPGSNGLVKLTGLISPGAGTVKVQFASGAAGNSAWIQAAILRVTTL
jgi:hypothetical protein